MKSYFWYANIVSKLDIVYVWSIVLGRKVACRVNTECLTDTARPHTHSNAHLYSCKPKPIVVPHVWGQQLWCEPSIMLTAIISFFALTVIHPRQCNTLQCQLQSTPGAVSPALPITAACWIARFCLHRRVTMTHSSSPAGVRWHSTSKSPLSITILLLASASWFGDRERLVERSLLMHHIGSYEKIYKSQMHLANDHIIM